MGVVASPAPGRPGAGDDRTPVVTDDEMRASAAVKAGLPVVLVGPDARALGRWLARRGPTDLAAVFLGDGAPALAGARAMAAELFSARGTPTATIGT